MSYAHIYRLAVREAQQAEEASALLWREEQAAKERRALESGELGPRHTVWHSYAEAIAIAQR